jgi:hypothetical protein
MKFLYPSNARLSRTAYFSLPGHTYFLKFFSYFTAIRIVFLKMNPINSKHTHLPRNMNQ